MAKAPRSSSPRSHNLNAPGRLKVRLGLISGLSDAKHKSDAATCRFGFFGTSIRSVRGLSKFQPKRKKPQLGADSSWGPPRGS